MEINWDLRNLQPDKKAIITVGTFDGIHVGHQTLLRKVLEKAEKYNGKSTLVTFTPHPKLVVGQKNLEAIKLLSTIDEKIAFLNDIGLDRVIIIKFTEDFSKISSKDFIEKILVEKIGFQEIVVGHDHAFGRNRKGSLSLLRQLAARYHYRIQLVDAVCIDGEIVSSTILRNLLTAGSIEKANRFLGRPYSFAGRIVKGDGRGRYLNFPTANIQPLSINKLIPRDGVYAVRVKLANYSFLGAMNIGIRPTFSDSVRTIEVYLSDFEGDIYGERLVISCLKRLRDEIKFDSADKLIHQMELDVSQIASEFGNQAVNYFTKHEKPYLEDEVVFLK